ncbi:MAG: cardiolipin synthase [Planctomycetaceae bacterium]
MPVSPSNSAEAAPDSTGASADEANGTSPAKKLRFGRRFRIVTAIYLVAHALGLVSSYDALMSSRTSQGAVAWIISLNTFPYVAVPAYWVIGRTKFSGYVSARQELHKLAQRQQEQLEAAFAPFKIDRDALSGGMLAGQQLAEMPYLQGNRVDLLIDGEATFDSILLGIKAASDYVLVQFYIVRNDELGTRLKEQLIAKARAGVKVWFLYDEIGSRGSGMDAYWKELRDAGVDARSFHTTRGPRNRFQLNFRNHRKIVVVDGAAGWVGGHNVGDEYVGQDPEYPNWRDTHVRIEGPSVMELQLSFVEDWRWATDETLPVSWTPRAAESGSAKVLILPTGPADRLETCSLMYQQAIHSAKQRIWIASPYFVPDTAVLSALHLAALRGVDVTVIIPDTSDSAMVYYSAFAFVDELLNSGVKIYRYEPGFMHQKVFLVDDVLGGVGTANFDNRSFRLNFEVTALVHDRSFVDAMENMFLQDIERSKPMTIDDIQNKPWWFQALSRASYLAAPIQ